MQNIQRSYFRDIESYREYVILQVLKGSENPIGSWVLKEELEKFELEVSIATIGRFLKILDQKGFTILIKNQGRKISNEGIEHLNTIEEDFSRFVIEKEFIDASIPNTEKEFLDLLYARKVIEIESARLAAIYATKEDIENLECAILEHYNHINGNDVDCPEIGCKFHELIGQASHNRFLHSTLKLLIFEEMEMEKKFPYPSTIPQGMHYIQEHEKILAAIKDRDPEQVMIIMEVHMVKLIQEIKSYFKEGELNSKSFT